MDTIEGVFMWDKDSTEISPENFSIIVKQYLKSNCFIIRLSISSNPNSSILTEVIFI